MTAAAHPVDRAPASVLTTTDAAAALGVTPRRVLALIAAGRLRAERFGRRGWLIRPAALEAVRVRRPGRPAVRRAGPTAPPG
jgi:excisionase family DNA binding protein